MKKAESTPGVLLYRSYEGLGHREMGRGNPTRRTGLGIGTIVIVF